MQPLIHTGRPLSILVVEPHHSTADRVAEGLRDRGCVVLTATSREEARQVVTGVLPDVVLIGIGGGPGGLHAYEFAREVRRLTEKKPPLLVAVTGPSRSDRPRLLEAGFDLKLSRSVGPEELLSRVAALRHARPATDEVSPPLELPAVLAVGPSPVVELN